MKLKLKETDRIIWFWYAEDFIGGNFLMLLRRRITCWQLDWRFHYGEDRKDQNHKAVSGLQLSGEEAFQLGQGAFSLTQQRFTQKRISQRVDGDAARFFALLRKHNLLHIKNDLGLLPL